MGQATTVIDRPIRLHVARWYVPLAEHVAVVVFTLDR